MLQSRLWVGAEFELSWGDRQDFMNLKILVEVKGKATLHTKSSCKTGVVLKF